jgi:branched-chain amino acid transport system substrate-binding protein
MMWRFAVKGVSECCGQIRGAVWRALGKNRLSGSLLGLSLLAACVQPALASGPDSINLGALLPLTGNAGYIGEEARTGLNLFLAQYDKRRGAEGLPAINAIYVDSQADARAGFEGYQLLSTRYHPQIVFLTYTNVAKAAAPQAKRDHAAMLNMTQGAVTLLGQNFTSLLPAYTTQAEIDFSEARNLGVHKVSVIYENSEAFVVLAKNIQKQYCPDNGCQVVASEQLPAGATEVDAQVTGALAAKPDAVVLIGIAPQLIPVARELQAENFHGQILGFTDMREVVTRGDGKLIEGAIYPNLKIDAASPAIQALDSAYQAQYGHPPTQNALISYEAGQVIEATLLGLKARNLPLTGDNFVIVQKSIQLPTILGEIHFLPDGRVAEPMQLIQVRDGKATVRREIPVAALGG